MAMPCWLFEAQQAGGCPQFMAANWRP
jgi:hypothetical protein